MSDLENQIKNRINIASHQQRLASDPSASVWVEASAGTGKTKVLSDRVLRLLLNGANPARLLCLTYTKAAAVEMSNRISSKLSNWAIISDEKLQIEIEKLLGINLTSDDKLIKQARNLFAILLDTPGGIKIQTIHSFCQEILKRFPLEAKISPHFEIMDDRSSSDALEEIKKELLQGKSSEKSSRALAFLTSTVSEFKFPLILQSITENRNLLEKTIKKYSSIEEFLDNICEKLNIKKDQTVEDTIHQFWSKIDSNELSIILEALKVGSDKSIEKSFLLSTAIKNSDFPKYIDIFLTKNQPRKNLLVKKSKELYPYAEKAIENETNRLISTLQTITAINLFKTTSAVLILAEEILSRYNDYKKTKSKMDYNDLIILTKNLLETPKVAEWILFKLDGGIDNILIDEAQDTSPEQWAIIKSLTDEFFAGQGNHETTPTIFVVGDRKQSIYSFQGADPKEFEKMHDYFSSKAPNFRNINMDVSFRSTSAILDAVNITFSQPQAQSGVVKNNQNITHISSRIGHSGKIEIWPLIEPEEIDKSDKIWLPPVERVNAVSSSARLARQIAETIKAKVSNKEILKSQNRPLRYRDFLILVQRRNSFVEEVVRACKTVGVSIAGVDKIKLSDQIAIKDLIAAAKFALLPQDDLNLACLLKSPLFNLDDNDLFNLCFNRKNDSLWYRIKNSPFQTTFNTLEEMQKICLKHRPFEFFSYILNVLKGREKFISRLGYDCEDAIDEFMNLCLDFEKDHIPSIQIFIDWISKGNVEIKRDLEQNDSDAVRLMTVHGSKGLQAPIVILPDTVHIKNIKQEARWFEKDDILFYPLGKENYEQNCKDLNDIEKQKSLDEYHRLLYVALTRAEDCLYICGYKKKNNPNDESWYEICKKALSSISNTLPNKTMVYETPQQIIPKNINNETPSSSFNPTVPTWLNQTANNIASTKTLTPSHQDENNIAYLSPLKQNNNENLYSRGRIIHKLLQFLPSNKSTDKKILIDRFLNHHGLSFSQTEKEKIKNEVINLISNKNLAPLFSQNSQAEVSLMGQIDDVIISGQIDRLVITKDKVMIIDYKTNRPAAQKIEDVPNTYIKQMQAYRKLVSKLYPTKKIETYILWTNTTTVMKIE